MDEVLGAQGAGFVRRLDAVDQAPQVFKIARLAASRAYPQREAVEHSGDAACNANAIMGNSGRGGVPVNKRARKVMFFQIISMHINNAGNNEISGHIDGTAICPAIVDNLNLIAFDYQ